MCLLVNTSVHTPIECDSPFPYHQALTATESILVTKMLEYGEFSGWFTPYKYTLVNFRSGKTTMKPHNCSPFQEKVRVFYNAHGDDTTDIAYGIHAFFSKSVVEKEMVYYGRQQWNIHPFKAIIPKGAKYYVGAEGDIVSDKLIVFENDAAYEKYLSTHKRQPVTLNHPYIG